MSIRARVIRGGLTLGAGQAGTQAMAFLRNVIVARLLTQADFGVAATFAITVSLFDMASNFAVDKLLVQSRQGGAATLQGVVHAFEAIRGLLAGLVLFAAAAPIAKLFDVPDATWAFQLLALTPVLRGFRHLDVMRVQRGMRFGPMVMMELSTQAATLVLAWPLTVWVGDYSAVLWLILLREAMMLVISHAVAERPYRLAWDGGSFREVFAFGWPLTINGLLIYGSMQGDRLIVGASYSMEELGVYAAAAALAFTPMLAIAKLYGSLALPALAEVQDNRAVFLRRYALSSRGLSVVSMGVVVVLVVFGTDAMSLSYGERYAVGGAVLGWLGMAQAVRLLRAGAITAAMSVGDTKIVMHGNLARGVGVVAALGAAAARMELEIIAAAAVLGEYVASVVMFGQLERKHRVPAMIGIRHALALGALGGLCAWVATGSIGVRLTCAGGMLACIGVLALSMFRELRAEAVDGSASRRSGNACLPASS